MNSELVEEYKDYSEDEVVAEFNRLKRNGADERMNILCEMYNIIDLLADRVGGGRHE